MIEKYIAFKIITEWYIPLAFLGIYAVGWVLFIIISYLTNKPKNAKKTDKASGEEK